MNSDVCVCVCATDMHHNIRLNCTGFARPSNNYEQVGRKSILIWLPVGSFGKINKFQSLQRTKQYEERERERDRDNCVEDQHLSNLRDEPFFRSE